MTITIEDEHPSSYAVALATPLHFMLRLRVLYCPSRSGGHEVVPPWMCKVHTQPKTAALIADETPACEEEPMYFLKQCRAVSVSNCEDSWLPHSRRSAWAARSGVGM